MDIYQKIWNADQSEGSVRADSLTRRGLNCPTYIAEINRRPL